jgi:hypothetical protein
MSILVGGIGKHVCIGCGECADFLKMWIKIKKIY